MRRFLTSLGILMAATVPAGLAYAAMLGLGVHRHAPSWAVSVSATVLVFGPPLLTSGFARSGRVPLLALLLTVWSLGILIALPIYFPGERQQAVATGLSLVRGGESWESLSRAVAARLPEEPGVSEPELPLATTFVEEPPLPPAMPLEEHQINLPFEGAGRRLSVPVAFEHGGVQVETMMMLDTGATYTTLSEELLASLGIHPSEEDPVIRLHTANGEREARVVLVDRIWLGNLALDGVAIATCEACSSSDTSGLLGLNVTGNYNVAIDADRQEVTFTGRARRNRRLDVKPFVDVSANVARYPGGRVEVKVNLANGSTRALGGATAAIHCDDLSWEVEFDAVEPGVETSLRHRLPAHEPCERYQVALADAWW